MSILMAEYDYATDIAVQKEEAYEDGLFAGLERGLATGREEGITIGLEQGAYQKAQETAKSFLSMGLEPEQVAQGTGLSLEVIQKLID